jgi:hypothetical protein
MTELRIEQRKIVLFDVRDDLYPHHSVGLKTLTSNGWKYQSLKLKFIVKKNRKIIFMKGIIHHFLKC